MAALVAVCRKLHFHSRILTVVAEVADIPRWPWDLTALLLTKGHIRVGVVGVTADTAAAAQAIAADTWVAVEGEVAVVAEANTEVPNARHGRQHRRHRSSRRHRTKKRNNSKGNNFLKRKK